MSKVLSCALTAMVCLVASGCGPDLSHLPKTVNATGSVTLDGNPVESASVSFIADTGNYHATAVTDKEGKFALRAFPEKTGAVPGSYKIEITKTVVEQGTDKKGNTEGIVNVSNSLPKKYAQFTTSGLAEQIPESGRSDLNFDLKSK